MKKNVGSIERTIRIVVGPQSPWALLGLVPLLTGITDWCPPYALLGISTCCKCEPTDHKKSCCSS
ncbi:MAG TPA: DUF2892 domain-containing protein [Desulfocapsa sulfexigens]|nr:DUF2892 domain-containing protein [Desulfocapsa sulfexigens]